MTFAQLDLGAAFLQDLCIDFAEKGLPAEGNLSVVAIQKKAHSLVCESESDETFTQASENLKQYADKVLDLFKRIHQHRLSARASADRASASANLAAAGGTVGRPRRRFQRRQTSSHG